MVSFQNRRVLLLCSFAMSLVASQSAAQDALTPEQSKFFESRIRPVLVRECYGCHSGQVGQVRGGLWLDTADGLRSGGNSGPAVVPNNLEESLLWDAINHGDIKMPPNRKLPDEVLVDFHAWIEMGAPDPRVQKESEIESSITQQDIEKGREFWSYKHPRRPEVPVTESDWPKTAIDQFIYAKLADNKLDPARDAEPRVLLRRLSFDLIGLPPTPEQLGEFEKEWNRNAGDALRQIVDALLQQPAFGERWGRHWLDVARYAESTGRELNMTFPEAWRYRDYVIDSFNQDKPYDRFVQEQLAGDMLPANSNAERAENLIATGFLAIGPKALTERNPRQFELDLVDEQIDVTTRVILGTSVACARCHDHKFDPIPQTDYYALAGIFRSMTTYYGTFRSLQNRRPSDLVQLPPSAASPYASPISAYQYAQLESELRTQQRDLREALKARRNRQRNPALDEVESSDRQTQRKLVAQAGIRSATVGVMETMLVAYEKGGKPIARCMGVQEASPVTAKLLERGEFNRPGPDVPRGFPQVLCSSKIEIAKNSTGRLEFARWVGSTDNPLVARVMVNRVWLHLFGNGIVRTPEDFGATGEAPTHPELLDYLATEFINNNWSVKHLIRSIVLSRTYRMSSRFDQSAFEFDPENRLVWRMEPKRLEAEAIRDSLLAISGQLQIARPTRSLIAEAGPAIVRGENILAFQIAAPKGGQSIRPRVRDRVEQSQIGTELLQRRAMQLDESSVARSVYLPIVRDQVPRSLDVFDFAESSMVIGKRDALTTADQGLYFLNNEFVIEQADAMAKRLVRQHDTLHDRIRQGFQLAYGRLPGDRELKAAKDFYRAFPASGAAENQDVKPPDERRIRARRGNANSPVRRRHLADGANEAIELEKLSALCQSLVAAAEFRFIE